MRTLLSVSADAKTIKGTSKGVLTGIMYFAPHTLSGFQVCPKASDQCKAACLYTAGRGIYTATQTARISKTQLFFSNRDYFMESLVHDIAKLERKAVKAKMIPAVRLNGTSDIAWEKIACKYKGKVYRNVMDAFPSIKFYDYSKVLGRKSAIAQPNYHLTFSLSENNDADAIKALSQGYNVAVVMNLKKTDDKPATWNGYPVINGDETDVRFMDAKGGHIVALTAKGAAKKMAVGTDSFIRPYDGGFNVRKSIQIALAA